MINLGQECGSNSGQCIIRVFVVTLAQGVHNVLGAISKDHSPSVGFVVFTLLIATNIDGNLQCIVSRP